MTRRLTDTPYLRPFASALAAICLLIAAQVTANWHLWEPVSFGVSLRADRSTDSPKFRIELAAVYQIDLVVDRSLPFEELNCQLGIDPGGAKACQSSSISASWEIVKEGGVVASGRSGGFGSGSWGAAVSRKIGEFQATAGHDFRMRFVSLQDAIPLEVANPRIVVHVHPFASKSYFAAAQLLLVFGGIMLLASIWWVMTIWHQQRNRPV